ncbi:MAG: serine/threonine protein kinase [Deltaproteobacteria bacterium]|nr:MAG: serine/threonine protein kinase [Deltaproteobacteria bacterium]
MEPLRANKEIFLGRYALIKRIGRGGMAEVWVGKAHGGHGFEKIVAIKILTPDKVTSEDYQRALSDEAKIHVTLKHPNIVDIYDFNFEAQNPYLVMEYVEGMELRGILKELRQKQEAMPVSVACFMILELAEALKHTHERCSDTGKPLSIVHRDVSPSNILISKEGQVKLSDFGIAKSVLQSDVTQVGQIKGKFRYMSPEQAHGHAIDHRSDIFSLGLVFYELLLGRPAYDDSQESKIYEMARNGSVTIPDTSNKQQTKILKKLLSVDPQHRYSDLSVFQKDIQDYVSDQHLEFNRQSVRAYLQGLQLHQMMEASAYRQEAENWIPSPSSQILDETGQISVLSQINSPKKRYSILKLAMAMVALFSVGLVSIPLLVKKERNSSIQLPPITRTKGSLQISTIPSEALTKIQYADTTIVKTTPASLFDIPFNIPITLTSSKKGYKTQEAKVILNPKDHDQILQITLPEIKMVPVYFSADPFAEVSIPNFISKSETSFQQSLPDGKYTVTFVYPPSGKQISTILDASQGGPMSCRADMHIDNTEPATANCRKKP